MTVRPGNGPDAAGRTGRGAPELALRVHADPLAGSRGTVHRYWRRELADPATAWLTPWCAQATGQERRHARGDVGTSGFRDAAWCPECTVRDWAADAAR